MHHHWHIPATFIEDLEFVLLLMFLFAHELVELVEGNGLLVKLHDVLHHSDEFLVDSAIDEALHVFLLLQHLHASFRTVSPGPFPCTCTRRNRSC